MVTKKVGIRVESKFHEIEPDTSEAFCYFAEMIDEYGTLGDESFTNEDASDLTDIIRELFEPDDEKIELYTEGELYCGDGKLEVRYREPNEVTGMGESVTSISFEDDTRGIVTITRGGDVYSALVLERGVRHTCAYNTDALPLLVYMTAKRIENGLSEDGGVLDMIYIIETPSGAAQYNHVTVHVTVMDGDEGETLCP